MSAVNIITQRNLVKQPQSVSEGITAATYGITPTNPTLTNHGQDAALSDQSTPTVAENRQAGKVDRVETTKVFEENTVKYTAKVMEVDQEFLEWLMNEPVDAINTPDESRTFLDSYLDEAGTEQFRQYKGCKPQDVTTSYDLDNYLIIEATLSYKTKTEDAVGPTIGSGSFGTPNSGTPLIHLDAGSQPFIYNSLNLSLESFSVGVSLNSAAQNALGSVVPLFKRPTQRVITGSSVVYKTNGDLQKDARLAKEVSAVYIIDSGNILIAFTKFKFMPSGEELKGDDAEATKENKSWEASTADVANTAVPQPPFDLLTTPGALEMALAWSVPFDGNSTLTDYIVEFKLATATDWNTFADGTSTDAFATVTGLTAALLYDFRISAVNSVGTSAVSETASDTPTA